MDDMRTFGKKRRLQADSHPDLVREFNRVVDDLVDEPEAEGAWSRKIQAGPLLNALALAFARMPAKERIRYASEALTRLSQWRNEEDGERQASTEPPEITASRVRPSGSRTAKPPKKQRSGG